MPAEKGLRAVPRWCDPELAPDRIVYVSCDSATWPRDPKILCEGMYELERVCACDMFPQSCHVETVVLLSRKDA